VGGGLLLALAALILVAGVVQLGFPAHPIGADDSAALVLSLLVSLTFLVFGFILTRNILKCNVERRANVLGSSSGPNS